MTLDASPSDRYVFSSGRVMFARVDDEGWIVEANRAFRDEFGLSEGHLGNLWDHLERSGEPAGVVEGDFDVPAGGAPMLFHSPRHSGELLFYVFGSDTGSSMFANRDQVLDPSDGQLLSELTTEMGNLIREQRHINRELNEAKLRIEELSHTDELTGLSNRRHFLEVAAEVLAHEHRHDRTVSVIMIDADRFKSINDEFGHQAGDQVLRRIGETLREASRVGDRVGRYGGEEFAMVLPETDADAAREVGERLRATIEQLRVTPDDRVLTISLGVAEATLGESLHTVLGRADRALYEAKARGRNRVVVASL